MFRGLFILAIALTLPIFSFPLQAKEAKTNPPLPSLPKAIVPDGLGVNIHFLDPQPGEMKMLSESGVRWVRMDLTWSQVEKEKGRYDFSLYDKLLEALAPYQIRLIFILDYSNPLYDQGLAPHTDEGRNAMARFAQEAVKRYRGKGILWEMWNEPNLKIFWPPRPNAKDYALLALNVGKAIREIDPSELFVGPATDVLDLNFYEECFKAGLLKYWDAVTIHSYRDREPETLAGDLAAFRQAMEPYLSPDRNIPVLSGEWGYAFPNKKDGEEKQAKYLARQWLFNISQGIPVSIWYDWRDDGLDPKNPEHHFGTVRNPYYVGRNPVFDPKPAYQAAQTLTRQLNGFEFYKRLQTLNEKDFALLFRKNEEIRLVVWTTEKSPHTILLPATPGLFQSTPLLGDPPTPLLSTSEGLCVLLSDAPQYLSSTDANDVLQENPPYSAHFRGLVGNRTRGCRISP